MNTQKIKFKDIWLVVEYDYTPPFYGSFDEEPQEEEFEITKVMVEDSQVDIVGLFSDEQINEMYKVLIDYVKEMKIYP